MNVSRSTCKLTLINQVIIVTFINTVNCCHDCLPGKLSLLPSLGLEMYTGHQSAMTAGEYRQGSKGRCGSSKLLINRVELCDPSLTCVIPVCLRDECHIQDTIYIYSFTLLCFSTHTFCLLHKSLFSKRAARNEYQIVMVKPAFGAFPTSCRENYF